MPNGAAGVVLRRKAKAKVEVWDEADVAGDSVGL